MILFVAMAALAADTPTYRLDLQTVAQAKVPVLGWQRSTTHTTALVELDHAGQWRQHVCTVGVLGRGTLAKTIIPLALVEHLPRITARAERGRGTLRVDLGEAVLGWDPTLSASLPVSADDPAVLDHELDGRPGATVQVAVRGIGIFGIEVVQRSRAVLHGTAHGEGYAGWIETRHVAQHVLGADHRLLRSSPQIRPLDNESTFSLQPTSARDCAALMGGASDRVTQDSTGD